MSERKEPKKKLEKGGDVEAWQGVQEGSKKPVQSPKETSRGRWLRGWREEKFGDTLRGERKAGEQSEESS